MTATMKREQEQLWDTVKILSAIDKEKAEIVLKTTIEKSLQRMKMYTPIISKIHFSVPDEAYLLKLKELDSEIQNNISKLALEKKYEFVVEYINKLSGISDEPAQVSKKILASILAQSEEKSKRLGTIGRKEIRYYTPNDVAKKLGLSDQTIRRMCEKERFEGAYKTEGGHWKIPEDIFITTKEQDRKAEEILQQIDRKNSELGDVDEFNL